MDSNQISQFLRALGCDPVDAGEWIRCSCPLAPFRHAKGTDSKPSFNMQPAIGGSRFHCFTCDNGTGASLLTTLEMYVDPNNPQHRRYDLEKAREILSEGSLNVTSLADYDDRSLEKEFYEWSDWALDRFKPATSSQRAMKYLTGEKGSKFLGTQSKCRGLTLDEVVSYNFRYDAQTDRVVIPFYDAFMRLAGARGRTITDKSFHDYTFHDHNNTDLTWCNEQVFQEGEYVVIVEGQFDMIMTSRVYPQTIANLTAKVTKRKMEKLLDTEGVILMLDNDQTGIEATEKVAEFLAKKNHRVGVAQYSSHDPDEATPQEIKRALEPFIHPSKFLI